MYKITLSIYVNPMRIKHPAETIFEQVHPADVERDSGRKSTLAERERHTLKRLSLKITELLQHRYQDSRTEYSS
jgi:hypothetical protein